MKIKVSVPATSANVGSGFDALGLAVTLYNTVTFEDSEVLEISASDGTRIPRGESNLVYRSAKGLFEKVGKQIPPLKITQTNPIPMARGLGSSSACIIAGLLGANRMLGDVLNTQELLTLATAIEGHPDNVAPALLGGLTSSVFEDGKVYSVKRNVDESLCFAAIVPDYKLLTEAARAALPKEVSHKDAVYNLSRAALVPAAFCEGRHDLLAIATEDKLHQQYRMPLMPGSREVFDMARLCGAKAVYVSGAGSTVMAVAEKAEAEKFYSKLEKGLELLEGLAWFWGRLLFLSGKGTPFIPYTGRKKKVAEFICMTVRKCMKFARITPLKVYHQFQRVSQRYNYKKTEHIASFEPPKSWLNATRKEDMYPLKKMKFDEFEVYVPGNVHEHLKTVFGDYMQLPPEDKRMNHRPVIIKLGD